MDRNEQLHAIEQHILENGVYQCKMGECFYGDEGPTYRERMANAAKSRARMKMQDVQCICKHCGEFFSAHPSKNQKYCSRTCYFGSTRGSLRAPYTGKEITIDGKTFPSRAEAARTLGKSTSAIQRMIKRGTAT